MSEKMSPEEIAILVNKIADETKEDEKEVKIIYNSSNKKQADSSNSLYKPIDFRKQNKLQYDNLGALKQIHEQFVKTLNSYFTMLLRVSIQAEVDFEVIEQLTYQQYVSIANKNCLWGVYATSSDEKNEGRCFMQFDTAFCDFFIYRSFGGSEDYAPIEENEERKMAEINKEVSKNMFVNVLSIYEQAWNNSNIMDFDMSLSLVDDNAQNLNLGIISSEMMLIIPIELSIFQKKEDDEGETEKSIFKIGIPYSVIEPVLDKLNISNMLLSHRSDDENNEVKNKIQKMSNLIEVLVGQTEIPFFDLMNLQKEDIIFLGKKVNEPYEVYIGGVKKYEARPYSFRNSICMKIIK